MSTLNSSVVIFDSKIAGSTDKISIHLSSVAGHKIDMIKAAKGGAAIIARISNIAHGCLYLVNSTKASSFGNFLTDVRREVANNAALYAQVKKGDVSLHFGRTSNGENIVESAWDMRGVLDILPFLSTGGAVESATIVESMEIVDLETLGTEPVESEPVES